MPGPGGCAHWVCEPPLPLSCPSCPASQPRPWVPPWARLADPDLWSPALLLAGPGPRRRSPLHRTSLARCRPPSRCPPAAQRPLGWEPRRCPWPPSARCASAPREPRSPAWRAQCPPPSQSQRPPSGRPWPPSFQASAPAPSLVLCLQCGRQRQQCHPQCRSRPPAPPVPNHQPRRCQPTAVEASPHARPAQTAGSAGRH
mmetsp:Transcript_43270/g.137614  ORF Transcript_43270/g.137614 Transcript_43270/m.137614 type:complete len:200 (+) Transcript_43270:962-1561(+)